MWMTGVLLSFMVMAVSIRALSKTLNVFEILSIRNGSGFTVLLLLALVRPGLRRQLTTKLFWLHGVRNVINVAAQSSWALGITLLPFATVFALEFTTPAWVALFAVFVLNERMTAGRIAAVVFGLCGVVAIARPGLEGFRPASFLVMGAAIGFAASIVCTKKLTISQTTYNILFWMNAMQLPLNLLGSDLLFPLKLGTGDLPAVLGIMVSGLGSHLCLTNAFRYGDATVVVPLDFFRLPLIALVGFWFYAEPLDPMVFVGAALIIVGVLWNLRDAARQT